MSTPPSLTDTMNELMTGIQTVLYDVASAIAENAGIIATIVVVGFVAFAVMKFGSRIFSGLSGWLKGLSL